MQRKMKLSFCLGLLCWCYTFSVYTQSILAPGGKISDYQGRFNVDTFKIEVKGLPNRIDDQFGLAKVCLNINHQRVSDLKIELLSPDGSAIWLTNRNGGDDGRNYMNTCFTSNGFNGYIHQGQAPFTGEYIPDGRFSFINNDQDPNGTWNLLIRDLRTGETGDLHLITLEFGADPMPNEGKTPCSFEEPENCTCPATAARCELLPDLIILEAFTKNQIKEYAWDDPYYPGQLRFAATMANVGDGPLETRGKNEWICGNEPVDSAAICPDGEQARQKIYQRVYRLEGDEMKWDDIPAGTNYFDDKPGHDHFHVDSWVEFRLTKANAEGKKEVVSKSNKVSYCLFETGICTARDNLCRWNGQVYDYTNLPNYGLGEYPDCFPALQGISVGGYDTYGLLYEGQYVELPPNLPSGEYILEIEIDPEHRYQEKTKANNTLFFPVHISKQMTSRD